MNNQVRVTKDGKIYRKLRKLYANQDVYEALFEGNRYMGEFENDLFHGYGVFTWFPFYDDTGNYLVGKRYDGEYEDGKLHGRGVFLLGNGDTYAGLFDKGLYHGRGILKMHCGDTYDGEWTRGKPGGMMTIKYRNGDLYEGYLLIGKYHGHGNLIYCQGKGSYIGDWARGKCHGRGTRVFSNSSKFVGEFSEGEIEGEGIMFFANGDQFVGNWRAGKMEGKGVLRYSRGDRYDGVFLAGCFFGEGKYTYMDGGYYSGEYKNARKNFVHDYERPECDGKRHGFGLRVWSNGSQYQGQWINDKMDGKGVLLSADGNKYDGEFRNNLRHGEGTEEYGNMVGMKFICPFGHRHNGSAYCKYTGSWDRGFFHGQGTFECLDGRMYSGNWKNGKKNGFGFQTFIRDGDIGDSERCYIGGIDSLYRVKEHKGMWEDNERHGKGTVTYVNGVQIEGTFVRGHVHGLATMKFPKRATAKVEDTTVVRKSGFGRSRFGRFDHGTRLSWLTEKETKAELISSWIMARAGDSRLVADTTY